MLLSILEYLNTRFNLCSRITLCHRVCILIGIYSGFLCIKLKGEFESSFSHFLSFQIKSLSITIMFETTVGMAESIKPVQSCLISSVLLIEPSSQDGWLPYLLSEHHLVECCQVSTLHSLNLISIAIYIFDRSFLYPIILRPNISKA